MVSTGSTVNTAGDASPRLRLLGPVELNGPVALRFLPERRFRLLAYLALQGAWISRDQLAHLFWPERVQDAARNNLRKLLFEVRALGIPALEDTRHALRWQIEHDVADFARAHAQNDHAAVLSVYRSTPLHGLDGGDSTAFSTWLRSERLRLRSIWREAVLATVHDAASQSAVDLCQRLIDDDPFDEEAVRAQMRALGGLGRLADVGTTYQSFVRHVAEELGVDVAIETRNLARELQRDRSPSPPGTSTTPSTENSEGFIGRGAELAELQALLADSQCRLITVTGPGGMGKSRLVKELVHRLPRQANAPIIWIALDDLTDVAQVAPRVSRELGLKTSALQDPVDVVAAHLAPMSVLLIFDNSEHLPRLSELVEQWLAKAPQLKIVSTARARMGVKGEWLVSLRGLEVPSADTADAGLQSDAARLFIAQAQLAQPRFNPSIHSRSVVALVRAVGGMPLAILLAASWVRLLPVADMVSDLSHLLDVLEQAGDGDERPEHRSVRATFEQSWRLLSPAEQELLMVLVVFSGTFTRTAVHDVSQAPLPVLASLIDKSLVQIDGDARCSLHPLIQQFAAQKLQADPAQERTARDCHAASYARLMGQFGHFNSIDQAAALRTIAIELPNILATWEWGIKRQHSAILSDCSSGLSNYFQAHGPIRAGLDLFVRAEASVRAPGVAPSDASWGLALELAAHHYWLGNYREVEAAGRRALLCARSRKSGFGIRASLNTVGLAIYRQGRLVEARRYLAEALKRARAEGIAGDAAAFAGNLVGLHRELGEDEAALRLANEALAGHRANGHRTGELSMSNEIGLILHSLDRPAEAVASYDSGLQLATGAELGLRRVQLLTHKASALLDLGQRDAARLCAYEALETALSGGLLAHETTCRRTLAAIEMASGDFAAAREQLEAAIPVGRQIGTALVIVPLLRDCSAYLEALSDPQTALRCEACADAHRLSNVRLLARHRGRRERLYAALDVDARDAAEADGAALGLTAALDLAQHALDSHVSA